MQKDLPLKRFKVVELSTIVVAPVSARFLADYGAEVIKVETPPFDFSEYGRRVCTPTGEVGCDNKEILNEIVH